MTDDESWRNELTTMGTPRKVPPRKRGPKWEPKKVEIAYHIVPDKEYQQIISEVAEIIYNHLSTKGSDSENPNSGRKT